MSAQAQLWYNATIRCIVFLYWNTEAYTEIPFVDLIAQNKQLIRIAEYTEDKKGRLTIRREQGKKCLIEIDLFPKMSAIVKNRGHLYFS